MEPRIIEMEAFSVLGLHCRGRNEGNEISQLWQSLHGRIAEIMDAVDDRMAFGMSDNMDETTGEFDYIAGYPVVSACETPHGMVQRDVPGGTYAVFSCTLPTTGQTFDYAYKTWIPQSGYQCGGGPDIERYDERFDPADPASEFEVYISIRAV